MDKLEYPSPRLKDGNVSLRRWTRGDLACVEAAAGDDRICEGTTVPRRFTVEAGSSWIERQWSRQTDNEGVSLAIAVDDVAVGAAVILLRPQPEVAGIGYWLVSSARGYGYAARAVDLLAGWGLKQGLARIEAWIVPGNIASVHVASRAGFELEGRLRSFLRFDTTRHDAFVYSRIACGPS